MGPSARTRICTVLVASLMVIVTTGARASSSETRLLYPAKKPQRTHAVLNELPDPPALYTKGRHRISIKWDRRAPSILTVNTVDLAKAESTERWAGRFAIELFERGVLIERVRFNFPMLGALPHKGGNSMASAIDDNMSSATEVSFPSTTRGDALTLRDRETGKRWQLAWPPRVEPLRAVPDDARPLTR